MQLLPVPVLNCWVSQLFNKFFIFCKQFIQLRHLKAAQKEIQRPQLRSEAKHQTAAARSDKQLQRNKKRLVGMKLDVRNKRSSAAVEAAWKQLPNWVALKVLLSNYW